MKPRRRETSVFSMSALDLFCSAMGVFMVLCFITMPFYLRPEPQPPKPEPEPQPPAPPVPPPPIVIVEPPPPEEEPPPIQGGLMAGNFVVLTWNNNDDVDLFVTRPNGKVDYFGNRNDSQSNSNGLVRDDQGGANSKRTEIWLHVDAPVGKYKVEVLRYSKNSNSTPKCTVQVLGKGLEHKVTLDAPVLKKKYFAVSFKVDREGSTEIIDL